MDSAGAARSARDATRQEDSPRALVPLEELQGALKSELVAHCVLPLCVVPGRRQCNACESVCVCGWCKQTKGLLGKNPPLPANEREVQLLGTVEVLLLQELVQLHADLVRGVCARVCKV